MWTLYRITVPAHAGQGLTSRIRLLTDELTDWTSVVAVSDLIGEAIMLLKLLAATVERSQEDLRGLYIAMDTAHCELSIA